MLSFHVHLVLAMPAGRGWWTVDTTVLWWSQQGKGAHSWDTWQMAYSLFDSSGSGHGGGALLETSVPLGGCPFVDTPCSGAPAAGTCPGPPPIQRLGRKFLIQPDLRTAVLICESIPPSLQTLQLGNRALTLDWANLLRQPQNGSHWGPWETPEMRKLTTEMHHSLSRPPVKQPGMLNPSLPAWKQSRVTGSHRTGLELVTYPATLRKQRPFLGAVAPHHPLLSILLWVAAGAPSSTATTLKNLSIVPHSTSLSSLWPGFHESRGLLPTPD